MSTLRTDEGQSDPCTMIEGMPDAEAVPLIDGTMAKAEEAVSAALRHLDPHVRVQALMEPFKAALGARTGRIEQACLYAALARRAAHADPLPASGVVLPFARRL